MKRPLITVENVIHLEVTTPDCICPIDTRCGGVIQADVYCPEHGHNAFGPIMPIHSHKRRIPVYEGAGV
jgi:hypothetical protein